MSGRKKKLDFELSEIDAFDARRGYTRCSLPGIGTDLGSGQKGEADFWWDRNYKLVVRLSSQGYIFHLEASLASGDNINELMLPAFLDYMMKVLYDWLIEGVDDPPESVYDDMLRIESRKAAKK